MTFCFSFPSAASQVNLMDETFPIQDFEVVRGQLPAAWKSIAPNGNVTHIVVYKPLKAGYFNFTSAQISYIPSEGAELQVVKISMELTLILIMSRPAISFK